MKHYIFGYGSLVNQEALARYLCRTCTADTTHFCHLHGYRRCWNVAMDNRLDLPSYKYYLDAATGQRPNIFVTFLNIRSAPQTSVSGILFEVSQEELAQLDMRERNYRRIEITDQLDITVANGYAWVYIGTPEAEERYQKGLNSKTAFISEEYHQFVHDCFSQCNSAIALNYREATDTPEVPLKKLIRIDIRLLNE